jgi:protease-4
MKKNPLLVLLGISAAFFCLFLVFVFSTVGNLVKDKTLLGSHGGTTIGVIKLHGVIMDSQKTLKELKDFEEDTSVKAVLIRIDSPGGAVGPSQEIHDAVLRVDKVKPVIASMESVAASGGFYVAVAARKIVSNAGTLTGSIGVIMDFANLSELYKWGKVERFNIKSGKFKDTGSENRPMRPDERELLQNLIGNVYEQFLRAVATGRHLPIETVRPIADGRVLTGEQAFNAKLVDKLGGLDVALDIVREEAKLDPKAKLNLILPEPKKRSLLEMIGSGAADSLLQGLIDKFPVLEQLSHVQAGSGTHALMFL